ncbi:type 4 pilus major pilin [Alicycliphilus denitrificans]|uniref:type 4 pilus major pilin n=1 Tax=Alicycliphilus denitrificans TaxID=179636 RepID=UPI0038511FA4
MNQPNKLKAQKGFTITELAIVVLLGGVFLAMVWPQMAKILSGSRANKITNELNLVIPTIQTAYQNRTSYNGLTTQQVATNRWISDNFLEMNAGAPTGGIVTQWGTMAFAATASNTQVQVTIDKIPSRECSKIAEAFTSNMFLTASVNGTAVKTATTELDATTVGTQCNSSVTNTLVITFGRV